MTDEWRPSPTEGMEPVFDYGSLKKEHKETAAEIAKILNQSGQTLLADLIKEKFELVEKPSYDWENSPFVLAAIEAGLYCNCQGTVVDNGVNYQIVSITDDIRRLEKIIPVIINKYEEQLANKNKG
jgi:hypothetical protein